VAPADKPKAEPVDRSAGRMGAARVHEKARTDEARRKLAEHERRIYLPLVLSALLPIVVAASRAATDSRVSIVVNVVAWLVFVYDLFAHMRYVRGYLRTGVGVFDLVVVILTAPWFLLPGAGNSQVIVLARLARVVRLFFVSPSARQAARRLGSVGIFSGGMLLFCSWMAYVAEHPSNPDYATFGDALWWGVVTLTTVGYGDIVPETEKGRVAGVFLMVTGIATLGLISGTLASMFRRAGEEAKTEDEGEAASEPEAGSIAPEATDLRSELRQVRQQLDTIERSLAALAGGAGREPPPAP
jgi:voltage-gated potassium channel